MIEVLVSYTWVAFLLAAVLVGMTKRANLAIALGLATVGLLRLLVFAQSHDWIERSSVPREFFTWMVLAGAGLLLAGAFQALFAPGTPSAARSAPEGAHKTDLKTLFIPQTADNSFTRAEALRDRICNRLVELARRDKIDFVEQRSQPHSAGVWLRLDYLMPSPEAGVSLLASVSVDIERMDFHRFEHIMTVTAQVGSEVTRITGVLGLDEGAVDLVHAHITRPGTRLRLTNRLRQWGWQFWRPVNKLERLKTDHTMNFLIGATVLAAVITIPLGVVVFVGGLVLVHYTTRGRRVYVLSGGKPKVEPRTLRWMDSWQANISGLGNSVPVIKEGVMARLAARAPRGAVVGTELIGYWGPDRWIEREQIVVRHQRAMGYVHVEPYGESLYVAWESHLNSALWAEETLGRGFDRVTKLYVVANRVVAGSRQLNEYDVSDSNFLSEWMHEAVKAEVKLRMAELRIDEEIDFTVQRESRKDALSHPASPKAAEEKRGLDRFRRVA